MQVRIYNDALQRGMSPNEAKVYVYLIACSNRLNNAVVRIDTVRAACAIGSRTTVHTAIQGLCRKGLISKYSRRNYDGDYIANGYTITQLHGGWFPLDTQSMQVFKLDKSSFLVYLFFLKCKRHNSRKVFPSLNKIARALRTCKNTVIKAIRILIEMAYIRKSRPSEKGRLNAYLILVVSVEIVNVECHRRGLLASPMINAIISVVKSVCRFVTTLPPFLLLSPKQRRRGRAFFCTQVVHFLDSNILTQ